MFFLMCDSDCEIHFWLNDHVFSHVERKMQHLRSCSWNISILWKKIILRCGCVYIAKHIQLLREAAASLFFFLITKCFILLFLVLYIILLHKVTWVNKEKWQCLFKASLFSHLFVCVLKYFSLNIKGFQIGV